MANTFYTLEEANGMLQLVRESMTHLQRIQSGFREKRAKLKQLQQELDGATDRRELEEHQFLCECEMDFLQMEAQMHMNHVTQKGILVRSIEMGLVDFPGKKDGHTVYWCWKMGEESVNHFHGWDEGFSSRQLISESPVDYNE